MPIVAGMGRFFLHFGIACFILAAVFMLVINAYGLPVHPLMAKMATLIKIVGLTSTIMGALATATRVFMPGPVAQAAAYAVYLSLFGTAITGIAAVVGGLLMLLPIPGGIAIGLVATVETLASASMAYYLATRVSTLPPE